MKEKKDINHQEQKKGQRYLAPLNYDLFFKKVFSDLDISKKFLEDFFGMEIEKIEKLETKHRVTDEAAIVEFDYRCKMKGNYVIIDMQQWYKPDVAHRFYMYHSVSTALQLEDLPLKSITIEKKSGEEIKVKDFRCMDPVITLVWMVDDILGNEDDLLSYRMYPEDIAHFLQDSTFWREDPLLWEKEVLQELLKERKRILHKMNNKTKDLDFIQKNRLVFAFQNNIIKNKSFTKYHRWFELAARSKEKENEEKDFLSFEEDEEFSPIYQRIKKRLVRDHLKAEEIQYITDESGKQERLQRSIDGYVDELSGEMEMLQEEKDTLQEEKDMLQEEKDTLQKEKDTLQKEKEQTLEQSKQVIEKALKALLQNGMSEEEAKKILNLS